MNFILTFIVRIFNQKFDLSLTDWYFKLRNDVGSTVLHYVDFFSWILLFSLLVWSSFEGLKYTGINLRFIFYTQSSGSWNVVFLRNVLIKIIQKSYCDSVLFFFAFVDLFFRILIGRLCSYKLIMLYRILPPDSIPWNCQVWSVMP